MALSAIALCARALLKIGARAIASFDEGTAEAEVAANLYPPLRDAMLSGHPWTFATGQATLARLVADPVADFAHAYQLPSDFLRVISAGTGDRGRGAVYRLRENRLHTDADAVTLTYLFRPDERDWPAFFDLALIQALSAEFCLPLTESATRAEFLVKQAETEYRRAKLIDGQQQTASAIEHFPLVDVRR